MSDSAMMEWSAQAKRNSWRRSTEMSPKTSDWEVELEVDSKVLGEMLISGLTSPRRKAWERAKEAIKGEGERRVRMSGTLLTRKERRRKRVLGGSGRLIAVDRRSITAVTKAVIISFVLSL